MRCRCPLNYVSCNPNYQDIAYMFFECLLAVNVWRDSGLWSEIEHALVEFDATKATILLLLQRLSHIKVYHTSTILWSLEAQKSRTMERC